MVYTIQMPQYIHLIWKYSRKQNAIPAYDWDEHEFKKALKGEITKIKNMLLNLKLKR